MYDTIYLYLQADNDTRLTIRDSRFDSLVADEPVIDMVSCTMMRRFWLSWEEGVVRVGHGELPGYTIYELVEIDPQPVVGISFYNNDNKNELSNALWEFSETAGSIIKHNH